MGRALRVEVYNILITWVVQRLQRAAKHRPISGGSGYQVGETRWRRQVGDWEGFSLDSAKTETGVIFLGFGRPSRQG
ncbi:hypothetical protein C2S53_009882 [Perilla frutescens var. hirtella]|uniref:Uncharacterized protein n=1 Tax=Perilla frutescens var. hirtella TaxID=608512 RepID=A0AAD4JPC8_PERFH|nr:hypothetical protein C2S53_009882 [Perilla frutescens var. hirtella]